MVQLPARYLALLAKDVWILISSQFINNGLQCMSEMLRDATQRPADLTDYIQRAGQLLRVLAHVAESLRETALLPQLESEVQDEFIDAICAQFDVIHSTLVADGDQSDIATKASQSSDTVIFLARLLQYDLGFPGGWTAKTKGASNPLVSTLFRLALVSRNNHAIHPLLMILFRRYMVLEIV